MSILDFKEIPQANIPNGEQDQFELFARDFLVYQGFEVVEDPSRGNDGGKDMVVCETRAGVTGSTNVRWLVSCKHFAPSGRSVGADDEANVVERVAQHGCNGFLGVYSTVPSSGLADRLVALRKDFQTYWFD